LDPKPSESSFEEDEKFATDSDMRSSAGEEADFKNILKLPNVQEETTNK
jgi:hypothetical protein